MKQFLHFDASSLDEACKLLAAYNGRAKVNAGGSDLLTVLKADILPDYPEAIVNIKTIPGLNYIVEDGEYLRIGALTTLDTVETSPLVREKYPALARAARSVASPQIRNVGTLGGNLCQDTRCWYYRYPSRLGGGALPCPRKGSGACLAVRGDNRYHAILGGKGCFAVCPSDTAIALTALDAHLLISSSESERRVALADFYRPLGNILEAEEIVREIQIPSRKICTAQSFVKYAQRKAVDFAIASAAAVYSLEEGICTDARIVLGAVAPTPFRAVEAERVMIGSPITGGVLDAAAEAALTGARPLRMNAYKVRLTKSLVKQAILSAVESRDIPGNTGAQPQ